jgi:HTH-type transcriptional regulator/antitoxin HigA
MSHAPATARYTLSSRYLALLRRYPLYPIRSETDYDRATAAIADLFGRAALSADERRYVDAVTTLIEAYEAEQYDFDELADKSVSPRDALRSLMETNGMDQKAIAEIGQVTPAYVSLVLAGRRTIGGALAKRLAAHFRVDASLFL